MITYDISLSEDEMKILYKACNIASANESDNGNKKASNVYADMANKIREEVKLMKGDVDMTVGILSKIRL